MEWADHWEMEDFSNAYRNWLLVKMKAKYYGILFDILYDTKFEWSPDVPRDCDREADGRYLRLRYSEESGMELDESWLEWPCSFLEFLVALAYSIDDDIMYDPEKPDQVTDWFWEIMSNLGLDLYTDEYLLQGGTLAHAMVSETVNMVMERRYDYNGYPGMFPLKKPAADQRQVEIWYQANAYFIENYFN